MENLIPGIGSKYCRPEPIKLIIDTESGLTRNINSELVFRVRKPENITLHKRRFLSDSSGNTVLNMSKKIRTLHGRWLVFKGDSKDPDDLAFSVKQSSSKSLRKDTIDLDVFIPPKNTKNRKEDYNVIAGVSSKGFYCTILDSHSSTELVKMEVVENGDLEVEVKPNVDYAFIVALITIVADKMNFERNESIMGKAGQRIQNVIGALAALASVGGLVLNAVRGCGNDNTT